MQNPHGLVGTDTPTTARMYLGCLSSTALRSVRTHWREPAAGSGTRRDGEHSLRCCGAEGTLSVAVRPVVPGPVTVRPALTTWRPATACVSVTPAIHTVRSREDAASLQATGYLGAWMHSVST